jgi:hypothetical protein
MDDAMHETDSYLWDKTGRPDPFVEQIEQVFAARRRALSVAGRAERAAGRRRRASRLVAAVVVAAAVAATLVRAHPPNAASDGDSVARHLAEVATPGHAPPTPNTDAPVAAHMEPVDNVDVGGSAAAPEATER